MNQPMNSLGGDCIKHSEHISNLIYQHSGYQPKHASIIKFSLKKGFYTLSHKSLGTVIQQKLTVVGNEK